MRNPRVGLKESRVKLPLQGHTARRAISGSWDKTLKVWELESGETVATFTGEAEIRACAVGPDGVTFVAGDGLGRVHFLRLENLDVLESKP